MKAEHKYLPLSVRNPQQIDAVIDFAHDDDDGRVVIIHDRGGKGSVEGLQLHVGKNRTSWRFVLDRIDKGARLYKEKAIGRYDRGYASGDTEIRADWHMDLAAARDQAKQVENALIRRELPTGKGQPFAKVFEDYLVKLRINSENKGKPATHMLKVQHLGNKYLLPKWGKHTLADLSERAEAVGDWMNEIADKTPATAAHLRSTLHAIYRWRQRRGAKIPIHNPGSAPLDRLPAYKTPQGRAALPRVDIEMQWPAWIADWRKITDPMQRAYWLFLALTGSRPGEALRTKWEDVDRKRLTITIRNSKAGHDIIIPMSPHIERILERAREAAGGVEGEFVFFGPNAEHWSHREPPLGVPGHGLRRTFKDVCGDLGIDEGMSERLMGHRPPAKDASKVSMDYGDQRVVQRAKFLRDMQAQVSAHFVQFMGCDPTTEKAQPLPQSPREAAQAAEALWYAAPCQHHGETAEHSTATGRCRQCVSEKNARQAFNRAMWSKADRVKRRSHRRGNPVAA